jgi:hypothetical protein
MTFHFQDAGLDGVWLQNGYEIEESPYGPSVSFNDVDGLLAALAKAIVQKPARLAKEEFHWLRRYVQLSQKEVGALVERGEQLISLIERGKQELPTLIDREFRRLVAERLGSLFRTTDSVADMARRTNFSAKAATYVGKWSDGHWSFDIVAIRVEQGDAFFVAAASSYQEIERTQLAKILQNVRALHASISAHPSVSIVTNRSTPELEPAYFNYDLAWSDLGVGQTPQLVNDVTEATH